MPHQIHGLKLFLGFLCLALVWVFPFAQGASLDALQQLWMVALLSAVALLFGLSRITTGAVVFFAAAFVLMLLVPTTYLTARIEGLVGVLVACIGCHLGATMQRKPDVLVWFLYAMVLAALANAAQGLLQWLGLASELWPWVAQTETRGVAFGAFRQTNLFATFLCVGAISTVWLVALRRISAAMAWFFLLLLVFAVAASSSRTGALEIVALSLLGFLCWHQQKNRAMTSLWGGMLVIFLVATCLLPWVAKLHGFEYASSLQRAVNSVAVPNTMGRWLLWGNAWDLVQERPWWGWGWAELGYGHYMTILDHRFSGVLNHAHNLPLHMAVEFGLPLAILFSAVFLYFIYLKKPWCMFFQNAKNDGSAINASFAWMLILVVVGIHSMLELPLWSAGFLFLAGVSFGYLLTSNTNQIQKSCWALRLTTISALGLIALSLFAWSQYRQVLLIYKAPFNDKVAQKAAIFNARGNWLFQGYLDFAELGQIEVHAQNAEKTKKLSEKLLHFSAQPIVIKKLLLSLWYLHEEDAFYFHAERYCRAFPESFLHWVQQELPDGMALNTKRLSLLCQTQLL